jgi:fatty acid desaturase
MTQTPEPLTSRGEEFRADERQVKVRRLPPEILRDLTTLDALRSTGAILQTLAFIIILVALAVGSQQGEVVLLCIVLLGAQQHALFILLHEAAHYRLFANRRLNDGVGRLIGSLTGLSMCTYRIVHRLHHNHLFGPQDPDVALNGGYPRGKAYLCKKLLTDLSGLTALKTYRYFFGAPAKNDRRDTALRPLDDTAPSLRAAARRDSRTIIVVQLVLPLLMAALGGWGWLRWYLLLWIVPLVTVIQALLRLRAICEHGASPDETSPLTAARTNRVGPLARLLLFPHHVNYHIEHHLYPAVPHYHLPALHRALQEQGLLAGAEIRTLRQTWQRVYAPRRALPAG